MPYILNNGTVTRFIFQQKQRYSTKEHTVHYKTFMPSKNPKNRNEHVSYLSVCVISKDNGDLREVTDIWQIGCIIETNSGYTGSLEARADVDTEFVNQIGLIVEVNCIPIKEHAHLKPFPKTTIACQRLATDLALNSRLQIK